MKFAALCTTFVAVNAAAATPAKPPMGWNSWNTFKYNVSQSLVESTAREMVRTGLTKAGYNYVLIDDGWQAHTRDSQGRQQTNTTKFPDGLASLSSYLHGLSLKIGIYSDAGIYDCGFYPGSHGYEELDAATYAAWGIDYLKYDNCGGFEASTVAIQERFLRMRNALQGTGRDIFYSLCQWGNQFPWFWADQFSDSYRMSGDIHNSFDQDKSGVCKTAYCLNTGYAGVSVLTMIRKMREISGFQKPGAWADMDMLVVGMGGMNQLQEQTHFSFWAALKSPLIIGADMTKINKTSLDILLNRDIIAISQDAAGVAVHYVPDLSREGQFQVWGGPLASGQSRYVVLALNDGTSATDIDIDVETLGLQTRPGARYSIKDIWTSRRLGRLGNQLSLKGVKVNETKVLVISED